MVVYTLALISFAVVFLVYPAKPCSETDMGEQGGTFYLRDFHNLEHVEDVSYRLTSERSHIVVPGMPDYAPTRARLRRDGWRPGDLPSPTLGLRVNGRELSSSDVSSGALAGLTLLVSLKFSGALLLFSMFT